MRAAWYTVIEDKPHAPQSGEESADNVSHSRMSNPLALHLPKSWLHMNTDCIFQQMAHYLPYLLRTDAAAPFLGKLP